jgi:hypothetical protein
MHHVERGKDCRFPGGSQCVILTRPRPCSSFQPFERCDLVRFGAIWCDLVRFGAIWCDLVRFGAIWCDLVRFGAIWCDKVGLGWCSQPLPACFPSAYFLSGKRREYAGIGLPGPPRFSFPRRDDRFAICGRHLQADRSPYRLNSLGSRQEYWKRLEMIGNGVVSG